MDDAETDDVPPVRHADDDADRRWMRWLKRRGRRTLVVAAVVLLVAGATVTAVSLTTRQQPLDLVEEYLHAIQSGDVDAALALAGDPSDLEDSSFTSDKPAVAADLSTVDPEELTGEWEVERIVERHRRENTADVDVTIRAADGSSRQGRFAVVRDDDDDWRIAHPFVEVTLTGIQNEVELSGWTEEADENGTVELVLLPGVYELFPSLAGEASPEPSAIIAVPEQHARYRVSMELTDDGADAAQQEVHEFLDECAASDDIAPEGCPFGAEGLGSSDLRLHREAYESVRDLSWEVKTYPELHFEASAGGFNISTRVPGAVRVTGSGKPRYADDKRRTKFSARCDLNFTNVRVDLEPNGFTVVTADTPGRCR